MEACTFSGNAVTGRGGALCAQGRHENLVINASRFFGNSAGVGEGSAGGAVFADRGVQLTVESSTFDGNAAYRGGAVDCCGATLEGVVVQGTVVKQQVQTQPCLKARRCKVLVFGLPWLCVDASP